MANDNMEFLSKSVRDVLYDGDYNVDAKHAGTGAALDILESVSPNPELNSPERDVPIGEMYRSVDDFMRDTEKHTRDVEAAMESARIAALRQKAHQLSFIVITTEADAVMLDRMMASLPKYVEVCIVVTEKSDTEEYTIDGEYSDNDRIIRLARWKYKQFSVAKARNYSIDLASYDWCVWMDSDDVLVTEHHKDVLQIPKLEAGIGGVEFGCAGFHSPVESGAEGEYYAAPHLRAFRKSLGARFRGLVHEQIRPQIEACKMHVLRSHIMVLHLGYMTHRAAMIQKVKRNLDLLKLQVATSDYLPEYYEERLAKTVTTYHEIKGI